MSSLNIYIPIYFFFFYLISTKLKIQYFINLKNNLIFINSLLDNYALIRMFNFNLLIYMLYSFFSMINSDEDSNSYCVYSLVSEIAKIKIITENILQVSLVGFLLKLDIQN